MSIYVIKRLEILIINWIPSKYNNIIHFLLFLLALKSPKKIIRSKLKLNNIFFFTLAHHKVVSLESCASSPFTPVTKSPN